MRQSILLAIAVAAALTPLAAAGSYTEHRFFDHVEGDQPVFSRHDIHEVAYGSDGDALHVSAWLNQSGVLPYNPSRYHFFLTFVDDADAYAHRVECEVHWGHETPFAECDFMRLVSREEVVAGISDVEYERTPIDGRVDVQAGMLAASVPYGVMHAASDHEITKMGARSWVCAPEVPPVINFQYCQVFVDEAYDWEAVYPLA